MENKQIHIQKISALKMYMVDYVELLTEQIKCL